jgi:hypothetical protein
MHDTTSKGLFEGRVRTFSHGCIRIRDPQRFAEVVLGEGKGWNKADVRWQARTKKTVRIELEKPIPIHNAYFTLWADASGTLTRIPDVYGHDKRIGDALKGVDIRAIAATDPALALKLRNEQLASGVVVPTVAPPPRRATRVAGWRKAVSRRPAAPPTVFWRPPPPRFSGRQGLFRAPPRPRGIFSFYFR